MLILTISSGIGFLGHTLILDPLRAEFGWSKGAVSGAITLLLLVSAAVGPVIGGKIDRYGPSPLLVVGSLFMGFGFALLARAQELWQLYAVYVLLGIGTCGTNTIPVSTVIAHWFTRRRGLAMSVAMSGLSLGGVLVVPVASRLLDTLGLRLTLPVFGLTFWIFVIPIALFIVKNKPAVLGLYPDGDPAPPALSEARGAVDQNRSWSHRDAMRTGAFWAISFAFFLVLSGQIAFMIHEISFLGPLLGTAGAATAVSLTSGTSFCGRFLVGSFVDRADKRVVAVICFLLQGGAVLTAAHSTHALPLYLCVMVFGLTMGNIIMIQPLIIGEFFGTASFGRVSGLVTLFTTTGSAFGPLIAGLLFDHTQSYKAGFSITAVNYLLASAVVLLARVPRPASALARPSV
jgi:MFS family permease